MKYAVTITRHEDEESDGLLLTDKWLTADQAIDLLVQLNELEPEEEPVDAESDEEEEEPAETPPAVPRQRTKRGGEL